MPLTANIQFLHEFTGSMHLSSSQTIVVVPQVLLDYFLESALVSIVRELKIFEEDNRAVMFLQRIQLSLEQLV